MLAEATRSWTFDVNRGPGWLFVRVHGPADGDTDASHLAESIWEIMQQQFARRVVVDLSDLKLLRSVVVGQLVQLHKRVYMHEGLMRIAGLNDHNYSVLQACRLHDRFPQFRTAEEAVMSYRPTQPR